MINLKVPSDADNPVINDMIVSYDDDDRIIVKITGRLFERFDFDKGTNISYNLKYYIADEIANTVSDLINEKK
jgi:hypothetical protein